LITETQALYYKSHTISDKLNNKINKLNFYLEIFLTLSVFLSSFLILTLEKDWWGGYLTADHNSQEAHNFKEWLANGKRFKK
jgi:hypothetical protein